ncbi:MAG: hypothetical protein MMC23_004621 [Stictis urceolatum]|nr:hypothetical protein [Stictis urceolata]
MDEWTAETFLANREEPIPAINTPGNSGKSSDSKHDPAKGKASDGATEGEDVAGEATAEMKIKRLHTPKTVFVKWRAKRQARLLQQVIPTDDSSGGGSSYDDSASSYISRPGFSLPLMTNNFRRFNARIGVVFIFQARAIRLFSWRRPTHTLSFLSLYTFLCLYPHLLPLLPCCLFLFFIFVPAYLARHPPPPTPSLTTSPRYTLSGPPLAPARVIRPANEMSRDFFHNMRDLQNVMADFSAVHDLLLDTVTPWTNFSREALSSSLFMLLTCLSCALFLASPLLPWRHIALVVGWALVGLGHPAVQAQVLRNYQGWVKEKVGGAGDWFREWSERDIALDEAPEVLEVEVFELQRRRGPVAYPSQFPDGEAGGYTTDGSPDGSAAAEYEAWMFSPSAWEPGAPARVAGERPKGTRFFEDVRPPEGWEWEGKKWVLDLGSREWVEGRILGGLEVEVEGERWVYDARDASRRGGKEGRDEGKRGGNGKKGKESVSSFEGESEGGGAGRGEWRRRRWVRLVRRRKVLGEVGSRVLGSGG